MAPLGGAVTGFAKTYKRERADALVKAVDFEAGISAAGIADILTAETLRDPGVVEVGYKGGHRWSIGLREQPAVTGERAIPIEKDTVFVVTGAAGSIVSAITADLATASGGTFYLLDIAPAPDPNNPDIRRFVDDKEALKRDLFARIQARGERATPALVEKELASLERLNAAQAAIDAVHRAGGSAEYFSVNLTEPAAISAVVDQIGARSGRIDVLLHAAGLERSHFLPDKDPREFDLVFDVKADGWFNLIHTIGDMPLGATVAFSSVAGRFGNGGQADYSAANDLLCKIASSFRTTRPATRALAIDWTAWDGIGMATRGSIPKMMAMAGIEMLPPDAGIPLIRRELNAGLIDSEIVAAKALGILVNEWDASGGLDSAVVDAALSPSRGPMIGTVRSAGLYSGLTIEATLDPKIQPFLYDHQIEGTPVLPGVMGIEAFAEAATFLVPGWSVEAVEAIQFLAPFKFYRNEPRTVTMRAFIYPDGDALVAECRLNGCRQLPNQTEPQVTTHFTGKVRLAKAIAEAGWIAPPVAASSPAIESADVYRLYFHGPAYRVLGRAWHDDHHVVGKMAVNLPPNHEPAERQCVLAPRLIELCFQTAGIWEMGIESRMGLPERVERIAFASDASNEPAGSYALVVPDPDRATFDADIVDAAGNRRLHMIGYRTIALPGEIDAEPLKSLHAAMV
jgi:NAD(P)-dependent dehydrogenase (short-subunit alcohol dehydrogenase family)